VEEQVKLRFSSSDLIAGFQETQKAIRDTTDIQKKYFDELISNYQTAIGSTDSYLQQQVAVRGVIEGIAKTSKTYGEQLKSLEAFQASLTAKTKEYADQGKNMGALAKQIAAVDKEIQSVKKSQDQLSSGDPIDELTRSFDKYEDAIKATDKAIGKIELSTGSFEDEQKGLKKIYDSIIKSQKRWIEDGKDISKLEDSLSRVRDKMEEVKGFQDQLEPPKGFIDSFKEVSGINLPDVSKLGPLAVGGAIVTGVAVMGKELANVTQEAFALRKEVAQLTNLSGGDLTNAAVGVQAISKAFGKEYDEILLTANAVSQQLGVTFDEALDQISEGLVLGADANGEYLDSLREYSPFIKQIGADQAQYNQILIESTRAGLFSDKGIDAVKEASIKLNEYTQSTEDALSALDESTVAEIRNNVAKGETFKAIQLISAELASGKLDAIEYSTIVADVFGSAGEDSSREFLENLQNVNGELGPMSTEARNVAEANAAMLDSQEKIAFQSQRLAVQFGGLGDAANLLFNYIKAGGLYLVNEFIAIINATTSRLFSAGSAISTFLSTGSFTQASAAYNKEFDRFYEALSGTSKAQEAGKAVANEFMSSLAEGLSKSDRKKAINEELKKLYQSLDDAGSLASQDFVDNVDGQIGVLEASLKRLNETGSTGGVGESPGEKRASEQAAKERAKQEEQAIKDQAKRNNDRIKALAKAEGDLVAEIAKIRASAEGAELSLLDSAEDRAARQLEIDDAKVDSQVQALLEKQALLDLEKSLTAEQLAELSDIELEMQAKANAEKLSLTEEQNALFQLIYAANEKKYSDTLEAEAGKRLAALQKETSDREAEKLKSFEDEKNRNIDLIMLQTDFYDEEGRLITDKQEIEKIKQDQILAQQEEFLQKQIDYYLNLQAAQQLAGTEDPALDGLLDNLKRQQALIAKARNEAQNNSAAEPGSILAALGLSEEYTEEQAEKIRESLQGAIDMLSDVSGYDLSGLQDVATAIQEALEDPDGFTGETWLAIAQGTVAVITSMLSGLNDVAREAVEERISFLDKEISEQEKILEQEQDNHDAGEAAYVEREQRTLDELNNQREAALSQQETLAKRQQKIDQLQQIAGLVTASVSLFKSLAPLGPIGIATATILTGTMFAFYAATQAKSKQLAQQYSGLRHGGYTGDGPVDKESGHFTHGQEFVHTQQKTLKHRSLFEAIHTNDETALDNELRKMVVERNLDLGLAMPGPSIGHSSTSQVIEIKENDRMERIMGDVRDSNRRIADNSETQVYEIGKSYLIKGKNRIKKVNAK